MDNLLAMPAVIKTILSVVVAILILLATITVHEFGHYIVGKLFKFKINEFAIGMGPAIYKKTKKNGEVFSIRIFPLGGFCAFEGEDEDAQTVAKENEKLTKESVYEEGFSQEGDGQSPKLKVLSENAFNNKKPWQRILVLIAGATFNFIVAVLIVMIYFTAYGHFGFMAYEVKTGSAIEASKSLNDQDIILSIDDKFMYFTTDLNKALNGKKKGDIVEVTVLRGDKRVTTQVVLRCDVDCQSMSDITPALQGLGIASVLKLSTNSDCVLQDGNYVYRFKDAEENKDCTRIYDLDDLYNRLKVLSAGQSIKLIIPDGDDEDTENDIVTLVAPLNFDSINKDNREEVLNAFGINDTEVLGYQVATATVRFGFFEGLGRAVVYSFKTVGVTLESLGQLITGKLALDSVSGPIGTISLTSQYVSLGFKYILNIASLIGMSIAIFNLLPIPALDGARAVFVLIEWIRGKPINRNVEGVIHFVGLIVLILFAVLVDLLKLF